MISPEDLQALREGVLADDNVKLAVAFGPAGTSEAAITLVLDCKKADLRTVQGVSGGLARRVGRRVDVLLLPDARPAAILMRQVLEEGQLLKDEVGQWGQVESEREKIVAEAEEHEDWARRLHDSVEGVVSEDESVTLAVEFGPLRLGGEDDPSDMNLLVGCAEETEEALMAVYARLQETGFRIGVMLLAKARGFPYALSHVVRTGRPLKDTDGEWDRMQAEREEIVAAGIKQHREVQAISRMYGGPSGTSMN